MAERKPIPREVELSVLDESRRRCALCFHLKGDLNEKHGQIAHLDKDPENNAEDNLAFLCMEHHSIFDSRTSQHKNYTISEAKTARTRLHQAIAQDKHLNVGQPAMGVETDRKTLETLIERTGAVIMFLRHANFAAVGFSWKELHCLDRFVLESNGPESEFINEELKILQKRFLRDSRSFLEIVAPETGEYSEFQRITGSVDRVHNAADGLCAAYDRLITTAKMRLAP